MESGFASLKDFRLGKSLREIRDNERGYLRSDTGRLEPRQRQS